MKVSSICIPLLAILLNACTNSESAKIKLAPNEAMPNEANLQDFERTKDPALGYPTPERLIPVLAQVSAYKNQMNKVPGQAGFPWSERGPFDTGGRTRAIMFDPSDASAKKVWAGGVTGGLWYNNDITDATSSWQKVDDFWSNLTVTCMAYDPNNINTFYVGTGESFAGHSRGAGIWKSTDGGLTWAQLSSTSQFYYINDIVVRNEGSTSAVLAGVTARSYQGTFPTGGSNNAGLQRSVNGGSNWTQVLPNISGRSYPPAASDIEIDADNNVWIGSNFSPYGYGGGAIYKSTNGTSYSLSYSATLTNALSSGRVELACAPSDANYVYALVEDFGVLSEIAKSIDGGSNWTTISEPADDDNGIPDTDMTRGQARYDLIAAVHPTDREQVIVGGISLFRTTDGGTNWSHVSKWSNNNNLAALTCALVHADQHQLVFRPGFPNQLVNGNDGGVYFCTDITVAQTTSAFEVRNKNYNVTQFYANAMSPTTGSNVHLAGAQDNGTQYFDTFGKASTSEFTGGDGAYCFIDQNQPDTLISSYVFNNYYYSLNGGASINNLLVKNSGSFINPAAYDYRLNILYSHENTTSINKTVLPATQGPLGTNTTVSLALGGNATAFTVSQHTLTSTTLFIGTSSGDLIKVSDADGGSGSPALSNISGGSFPPGTINNVFVGSSELEIVVVFSNYGVSSIWHTSDGGSSWFEKEGDLPDMPIRWFLQNPNDITEAIVATEVGVWRTANFGAASPNWVSSTSGLANVRVDMLQMRASDKQVAAATYGRGLFTSDAFSEQAPTAFFVASPTYSAVNVPVVLTDQSAALPTSWTWTVSPANYTLLNATTLSSQNPEIAFTQTGTYTIGLTATNSYGSSAPTLKTNYITVSQTKTIPYVQNFDLFTNAPDKGSDCSNIDPLSADWINLPNTIDDSDWLTDVNGTASTSTGPSSDHTLGTSAGKYLYIESSNCSDASNILYSPYFDFVNKSADKLIFYNHMYGSTMGVLNVYALINGNRENIWSQSGDQGNQWNLVELDVTSYNGSYVGFEFEALSVQNFRSDIALDDFSITELSTTLFLWDGGAATAQWTDALNWNTDAVPSSSDEVTLDNTFVSGSYTVNLNSVQIIKDLEIAMGANTVTLSGANSLEVTGVVKPSSGTISANGQLVLKATSAISYGQIAAGTGTISGSIVNEWYFEGAEGYRHIASPVVCNLSELTDDFNTLNFSANTTGSIWNWDASTSNWFTPAGGSASSFNQAVSVFTGTSAGDAFSTMPLVIDASGAVITGNKSQTLAFSSGVASGLSFENGADGWNFVYNPYPSAIQWSLVEAGSYPAELASTYYYWDANSGAGGAYASYNPNTSTSVNDATDFIAKGKAFWVQASTTPSASLNFTDAMRTVTEQPLMKTQSDGISNQITLSVKSNTLEDYAYYGEFLSATEKYDLAFDHLKMSGTSDALIYIENDAQKLAYNAVSKYNYPMPFKVLAKSAGKIEIGVNLADDFFGNKPRYIQNLATGKVHALQDGNLEITANAGQEYAFLLLHIKSDGDQSRPPFMYTRQGIIGVDLRQTEIYTRIEVLDISGRLIKSASIDRDAQTVELELNKSGMFIVHLSSPRGAQFTEKVVLID